eukprot:TRINITY_DN4362_c0_g2_i1.p1 TRINITY_DN4362_c0_g2~~TRINITY_DN4362_c0_g2_i1.p1  ORF type:complete len:1402 (-),score=303.40 TRINITY_DN4362_c0_g2_i1:368-4573(-)
MTSTHKLHLPIEASLPAKFHGCESMELYKSMIGSKNGLTLQVSATAFEKCFSGSSLLTWLMAQTGWLEDVALQFGQLLFDNCLISPILGRLKVPNFGNSKDLYYQFNALAKDNYELLKRPANDIISEYDLEKVSLMITDEKSGVSTTERTVDGKVRPLSFLANDVIDWLERYLKLLSKAEAVVWGNHLLNSKIILSTDLNDKYFRAGSTIYYFPEYGRRRIFGDELTLVATPRGVKRPSLQLPNLDSLSSVSSATHMTDSDATNTNNVEEDEENAPSDVDSEASTGGHELFFSPRSLKTFRTMQGKGVVEVKKSKKMNMKAKLGRSEVERIFRRNLFGVQDHKLEYDFEITIEYTPEDAFTVTMKKIPYNQPVQLLIDMCISQIKEHIPDWQKQYAYSMYLIPKDITDTLNNGVIMDPEEPLWVYDLELLPIMNLHLALRKSPPKDATNFKFFKLLVGNKCFNVKADGSLYVADFIDILKHRYALSDIPIKYSTIYVHTHDGVGFWLLPHYRLMDYPLKSMDLITVSKRQAFEVKKLQVLVNKKNNKNNEGQEKYDVNTATQDKSSDSQNLMLSAQSTASMIVSSLIKWLNKSWHGKTLRHVGDYELALPPKSDKQSYTYDDFAQFVDSSHTVALFKDDVFALMNVFAGEAILFRVMWSSAENIGMSLSAESLMPAELIKNHLYSVKRLEFETLYIGELLITNYRLLHICETDNPLKNTLVNNDNNVSLPLSCISNFRYTSKKKEKALCIEIECKDFRTVVLQFDKEDKNREVLVDQLSKLLQINKSSSSLSGKESQPSSSSSKEIVFHPNTSVAEPFAFSLGTSALWKTVNGWDLYNPILEFHRLGIGKLVQPSTLLLASSSTINISFTVEKERSKFRRKAINPYWRITEANNAFKLVKSYPKCLVVPAAEDDHILRRYAWYRKDNRLPVLSWLHSNGAAILRSSQPNINSLNQVQTDKEYIRAIADTNPNHKLLIYDARSRSDAMSSKSILSDSPYSDYSNVSDVEYLDLADTVTTVDAGSKLAQVVFNDYLSTDFWSKLEGTGWLTDVAHIINAANCVAQNVHENRNTVLVFCQDGCDQTSQVITIAMLILDPYYRTLQGFIVLIEKEWISFGHKFYSSIDLKAPLFLQWLDVIYQMVKQSPGSFEFNENLLSVIMNELYSCRFGTFLSNNEYDKTATGLPQKTISLWSYILDPSNIREFMNPLYSPFPGPLILQPSTSELGVWDFYLKFVRPKGYNNVRSQEKMANRLIDENVRLQKKIEKLEQQLALYTTKSSLDTLPSSDSIVSVMKRSSSTTITTSSGEKLDIKRDIDTIQSDESTETSTSPMPPRTNSSPTTPTLIMSPSSIITINSPSKKRNESPKRRISSKALRTKVERSLSGQSRAEKQIKLNLNNMSDS